MLKTSLLDSFDENLRNKEHWGKHKSNRRWHKWKIQMTKRINWFIISNIKSVSYTHLDVYKRQSIHFSSIIQLQPVENGDSRRPTFNNLHSTVSEMYVPEVLKNMVFKKRVWSILVRTNKNSNSWPNTTFTPKVIFIFLYTFIHAVC